MKTTTKNCLILAISPYFSNSRFNAAISSNIDLDDLVNSPSHYQKQLSLRKETLDYLVEKKYLPYLDKVNKWLSKSSNSLITYFDKKYPCELKQISNLPIILYCLGNVDLLDTYQLAIVGARNHTSYGKNVTQKIISELAYHNITITSGLAYGIDTLAHQYALENNLKTIAVIGTGIDVIYPKSNTTLYQNILSNQGLIISEFNLGVEPLRHNFPQRNRIISALSKGVLVVEAAQKSGSLITAELALEQNKEVFAIPGSIFNTSSSGCNELIKQGAKLVSNASDILEELNINNSPRIINTLDTIEINDEQKAVLNSINNSLTTIDQIINNTCLPYHKISELLFELEMKSLVETVPGGYTRRQPS
ncbi:DNA processing protein [Allofrancisella inopinata]|uniref:DNA-protecting protein DprA n=1 Tax=Allofrancisella inopinata TaxID=1085647 RepID=A0AAE7CRJ3_9GAMM|nr:DNA-processing protein DprA [Allofrancisella inopinata]QIV96404.1 DNA-protecting protein DprA [Allofrancisella inopinata]TDT73385.1 DNA processing protein [Allofrancisella inopinata]